MQFWTLCDFLMLVVSYKRSRNDHCEGFYGSLLVTIHAKAEQREKANFNFTPATLGSLNAETVEAGPLPLPVASPSHHRFLCPNMAAQLDRKCTSITAAGRIPLRLIHTETPKQPPESKSRTAAAFLIWKHNLRDKGNAQ